jgi:radical SAM protein with 4Fe4S-binding SPASM domain
MRIQGADLREKERVRLEEVVPLDTPMLMYLEPTNACNIRCSFCPTGDHELLKQVGRKLGLMKWELFEKIVDDLKRFPKKLKMINFFKDGEPLVNKKYPEMINHLYRSNVAEKIWSKTNGLLLNSGINQDICDSGLDMLGISVIAPDAAGYERIALVEANYEQLIDNVSDLFRRKKRPKISVKMTNVNFNQKQIEKFYGDFEQICDYITVDNPHGWSRIDLKDWSLGIKSDTYDGIPNRQKIVCPWTLYQLTINWNGLVQPCNEDWSWVNILGDASKESLTEIWNGKKFKEFQIMQLEGRRSESKACATCSQMQSQIDDVDSHRFKLRDKIKASLKKTGF